MYTSGTIRLLWEGFYSKYLIKLTEQKAPRATRDVHEEEISSNDNLQCDEHNNCGCDVEEEKN